MDLVRMATMPHQWSAFSSDLVTLRDLQALVPDFSLRFAERERNAKADLIARCAVAGNIVSSILAHRSLIGF
ncbi:unnamed protein product [Cochlearia groenlandica]